MTLKFIVGDLPAPAEFRKRSGERAVRRSKYDAVRRELRKNRGQWAAVKEFPRGRKDTTRRVNTLIAGLIGLGGGVRATRSQLDIEAKRRTVGDVVIVFARAVEQ